MGRAADRGRPSPRAEPRGPQPGFLTDVDGPVRRGRAVGYLSLFASIGTLVCCALPSLLVLLGFGAAVASVLTSVPWLVTLSRHKDWVFAAAALALVGNAYLTYRVLPRWTRTCPPNAREACEQARRWSRGTLIASVVVFLVGWFVAFALGPLLERFAR